MIKYWWLIWRLAATFAMLSVPFILHEYFVASPKPQQVEAKSTDEILDRLDTIEKLLLTQQELLISHLESHRQEATDLDNCVQNCQTVQEIEQEYSLMQHLERNVNMLNVLLE
ncbi:MAG: hypothetical protein OXF86_14745 [Caldilineaceae bacterium]|nr:hypothetical protein [Caldilineaceae bacterium]